MAGGLAHHGRVTMPWQVRMQVLGALVGALAGFGRVSPVMAAPPLRPYSTFSVACCDVVYQQGTEEVARRYAAAAQEAHDALAILLGNTPSDRVQILVTDDTDFSNGSATPLPYNTIRAYARPPGAFSELGDYDDWARALMLHEMVHIVHTDTIRGIPAAANWIFGKFWPPNLLMPRWFVEGLAVFVESRLTTGGRVHSSLFNMYLRTAALEGRLWDLDVLSSGGRAFPGGNGAYLYGGHFLDWLAQRYGDHIYAGMNRRNGGAAVPYALDWMAEPFTDGKSWAVLYDEWRTDITRKAKALQQQVERAGASVQRRLTGLGGSVMNPRLLNDGSVVFYATPIDDTGGLYVMRPKAGGVPSLRRITEVQSVQGLSPTPDGRTVIFSQPEVYASDYSYLDLFSADLQTGAIRRLTAGARLRDPDVHPDGRMAVAVENRTAFSRLVMVDLSTGAVHGLFKFADVAEVQSPRFNARGDAITFTAWRSGGYRDVYVLRVGQTQPERVTHDRAVDMYPVFSDDGESVYFGSDRDGVFNIYHHNLGTGMETQATRVVTGAFMPLPLERQGALLYTGFGADAYDLMATALPSQPQPPAFAVTPPPRHGPGKPLALVDTTKPRPYNPLPTMVPRAFLPVARLGSGLGLTVGGKVAGADLTGWHMYEASMQVAAPAGDYAWSLAYVFNGLPVALGLTATGYLARGRLTQIGDGILAPYAQDVLRVETSATLPLTRWRAAHALTLSYGQELRRARTEPVLAPDGLRPALPATGPQGYLTATWVYASLRRFRDSVAPERGRRLSARVRLGHPLLLGTRTLFEASADWREYLEVPSLPRHVWALYGSVGVARGDPTRRRAYFLGGAPPVSLLFYAPPLLRGYPPAALVGDGYVAASAEWRFPLWEVQQGLYWVPLFVNRLRGLAFYDQGIVFRNVPQGALLRRSVGGELLLDGNVFYYIPITWRLGMARGLDKDGLDMQLYTSVGLE